MTEPVNPFLVTEESVKLAQAIRQREKESTQRYSAKLAAYRELMDDARYKPIRAEITSLIGERIESLISHARSCPGCMGHVARIDVLRDVVSLPIEAVLRENAGESPVVEDADD